MSIEEDIEDVGAISVVPKILDIVCRTTRMGFAAVARVTEDRWVTCYSQDSLNFGLKPGDELKIETTICSEIRQSGRSVVFDDATVDPHFRSHHTPRIYGLRSYISVPIVLPDGSFFGTLCAIDPEPRLVDRPEVVSTLEVFADLIAVHLASARRLRATARELERERDLGRLREQFMAVLGHDLRNPLGAISAAIDLLDKDDISPRARKLTMLARGSVARISNLINDVMDFARGRLGGGIEIEKSRSGPLADTLQHVIDEVQSASPDRLIESDIDISEPVECDVNRIGQLFSNLLSNAVAHGAHDKEVRCSARTTDGTFGIWVANSGDPIAPDLLAKLFTPFVRGEAQAAKQGLGLGLYIASSIASAHGGTLDVKSDGQETRFTFRMKSTA